MIHGYDIWLFILLGLHIVADGRYLHAYVKFPLAVKMSTDGVVVALDWLRMHIIGAARFVLWCASSHGCDMIVMATMLVTMVYFPPGAYWLVFCIYLFTLIAKVIGAEYSHVRADALRRDSKKINNMLRGAVGGPEADNG